MKWHRYAGRAFAFAGQLLARNGWLSVALVLVFVLTLLAGHILLGVHVMAQAVIRDIEERVDVSVYFTPGTSEDVIRGAQEYLVSLEAVTQTTFVSAEEGLRRFSERHRADPGLLETLAAVGENPFGSSLVVHTKSPADFPTIIDSLQNPTFAPFVQKVDENDLKGVVEQITRVTNQIRLITLVLAGLLLFIATLMLFNAMRLAIYTHREEIGIMRLVGASRGFIRAPFLLQTILLGWVSVACATGLAMAIARGLELPLQAFLNGRSAGLWSFYWQNLWVILGAQWVGITLVSLLFSSLALSRYLKGQG